MRRRPGTLLHAIVVLAVAVGAATTVAACASGSKTSFTSLESADAQARAWVDATVTATFPAEYERSSNSPGRQTCTSSADFAEIPYEVVVTVPAQDVDRYTALAFTNLAARFGNSATGTGAPTGTAPVPPGPGSPNWSLFAGHDGFTAEIVGNRVSPPDPYVRIRIVTPCVEV